MSEAAAAPKLNEAQLEYQKRHAAEEKIRSATKRAYAAFQHPDIGLPEFGASILVVHLFKVVPEADVEKMTAAELRAWALGFQRQQPTCWLPLLRGAVSQFIHAVGMSGLKTADLAEFTTRASVIRG